MTIDERIEALTHSLELQAGLQADVEKRHEDAINRHDDAITRHNDAMAHHDDAIAHHDDAIAHHDEAIAHHDDAIARHNDAIARHNDAMARIDRRLDRAIRLAVQDARRQRNRNLEFDEKMTQLAAAQVVTEEKLQGLIDALRGGGNGKH
jgi:uncharacterized protein (DUF3084 family)